MAWAFDASTDPGGLPMATGLVGKDQPAILECCLRISNQPCRDQKMHKPLAGNQTDLNGRLWFFRSIANPDSAACLVLAHGGINRPIRWFTVPPGVTVNFYTSPGEGFKPEGVGPAVKNSAAVHQGNRPLMELAVPENVQCQDYVLAKVIGYHETGTARPDKDTSYEQLGADMREMSKTIVPNHWGANAPHVVTIRNRWNHKTMLLSEVVANVKQQYPAINTFYIGACRVEFEGRAQVPWPVGS